MTEAQIKIIFDEIKREQSISPYLSEDIFIQYIKEAEFDINEFSGTIIDYDRDLKARSLLKTYVLYAHYKKLAEFKELYGGDYHELQRKYYRDTNVQ